MTNKIKKGSSDLTEDLNPYANKNYKQIQQRGHEFWIKMSVTFIALVLVMVSFGFLIYFVISEKFRPHNIYDLPIILALSVLPMTILVLLIKYFFRNEINKDLSNSITTPQIEAVKSLFSAFKDICNPK